MMAKLNLWPNCKYELNNNLYLLSSMLPINKARTKALLRIGPHNKEVLDTIICGMLGDFWADSIPGKSINSTRFQIEQGIVNSAYIHYLSLYFYKLGYCARPVPILVKKSKFLTYNSSFYATAIINNSPIEGLCGDVEDKIENRFNYRLTLFTFTSFTWIYDSFYKTINGATVKIVPHYIAEFLTPISLAHLIMQIGHPIVEGLILRTQFNNISDKFISKLIISFSYQI